MNQIIDRIKFLQKKQGLTQHNLADSIGWDRSKVQRILNGKQNDSLPEFADLLSQKLKFDYEYLIKGNGEEMKEMTFQLGNGEGVRTNITIDIEGIIQLTIKGRMVSDAA